MSAVYLGHRRSLDLDLFVLDGGDVDALASSLNSVAVQRGWTVTAVRTYPGFRRLHVHVGQESTLVDIVHDTVEQMIRLEDKPLFMNRHVDPIEEITVNKFCAVLGRSDTKDLIDLLFISRRGIDVLALLPDACRKDAGMDPSTLAWVLSGMSLNLGGLDLLVPVSAEDLGAFRDQLVARLLALARPGPRP